MALSRPEPGPLTLTSTSLTPNLVAVDAAVSAARCAANGVLLRLPLKPTVPDEAQHNASPLGSVIVTVVLLNVALMCTTARLTLRRVFRFLALATGPLLPIGSNRERSRAGIFYDAWRAVRDRDPRAALAREAAGAGRRRPGQANGR